MRIPAAYGVALALAGLLANDAGQARAADDIAKKTICPSPGQATPVFPMMSLAVCFPACFPSLLRPMK